MFKTKNSGGKFRGALFDGLRLSMLLLGLFPLPFAAQKKPDLTKPFKKCWDYGTKTGLSQIIASDNDRQLIISNNEFSIISINPSTRLENWKSESAGKPETILSKDVDSLYFITVIDTEKGEKSVTLNSISLKTGITRWRKKLPAAGSKVDFTDSKTLLFFSDSSGNLCAFRKNDGNLVWRKNISKPILSLSSTSTEKLRALTRDSLIQIISETGETEKESRFNGEELKNSLFDGDFLLAGYSTGEVFKLEAGSSGKSENQIVWKIKAGGSISSLNEVLQGVLVTSLDNFIYLFSNEKGNLKWKRRVSGRININPLVTERYAVVVSSAGSSAAVIDLQDGKVVNQIEIDVENYFSGSPLVFGDFLVFQTSRGLYFYANTSDVCP